MTQFFGNTFFWALNLNGIIFSSKLFKGNVDEGQYWGARVAHHLLVNCCWTN